MTARNQLIQAPPYEVERALAKLGADLRTARLRRNLSREETAQKIGAGVRAIADAERGKPATGAAVYAALLWAFGLLDNLADAADPHDDEDGERLAFARERKKAGRKRVLDNDF